MKRFAAALMMVMILSGLVFAQSEKKLTSLIEKSVGKIEAISKPNADKGDFGQFSIRDAAGQKKDFVLIPKTKMFGTNSQPIGFDQLRKGDSVLVLYVVTIKGENDVISVTKNPKL